MFTRNRVHTTRAEQPVGIRPVVHSVLAVLSPTGHRRSSTLWDFSKEPPTCCAGRGINISGVDFWHAVEFSRNGRFLRSRITGALRALPFVFLCLAVLRFRLYQTLSCPIPGRSGPCDPACFAFQVFAFAFSLSSDSNVTRLFFVPFPVRIQFPVACGVALPFGGPDFIRDSESDFPPRRAQLRARNRAPCFPFRRKRKRTGAGLPDANRGPRSRSGGHRGVRPRRRPEGSSGGGGRCRTPTCRPSGAPSAGAGGAPSRRPAPTCPGLPGSSA
ncbi:hypothetical protein SCALM49S_00326 [Streptomyces californicus]